MGLGRGFFRHMPAPRILMLAAVLLLTISQFFAYFEDPAASFPAIARQPHSDAGAWAGLPLTGWELHPQAYLILALLGFALWRNEIAEHAIFRRCGYWIALALIFATLSPGAPTQAAGAGMGGIAFLMALVAAIWHQLLPRIVAPLARRGPPDR